MSLLSDCEKHKIEKFQESIQKAELILALLLS